ncbi:MAG TPA: phosphatase PAP2 family protein [Thermoleophilaceae bacterium]|nr:phosphatase PAP2 family protein [Thermoleophilaceae bacterium]
MRSSRALRTLAWGVVAVGVAAPLVRHRLRLRVPVVTALSFSAPVALALAAPRTRARDAGIYALQMWAYYAHYDMPDDRPEDLLARTRVGYPARIDGVLGGGRLPTHRLQAALGRPGQIQRHDLALSAVHWSWFLVPHGTAAYMLLFHHDQFVRSAILIAGTFDAGLLIYWSLPTAPPWYAAQTGRIEPVRRIMVEAGERFWKGLWRPLYDGLEGNPFAAMPSLHFGTSVMAAHVLSGVGRLHGAAGWAYALTLGFGLVYLGEHYVIDLIGGLALAEAVRRAEPHMRPLLLAAGRRIQQLEPGAA